jgi:hypothetical protein
MGQLQLAAVPHSETTTGRKSALKRGLAIPPASKGGAPGFPVTDPEHWEKARKAIGRVKNPQRRAQVAALLRRTAARFGKTQALKESWAAPGGSKHSNILPGVDLAVRTTTLPVSSPFDLVITRADDGSAMVRHRRGGGEITRIRRTEDGKWVAAVDGRDLEPHTRQRAALLQAISTHNTRAGTPYHRPAAEPPLQPPPVQTPLMAAYGIPAVRALATPVIGSGDGPRETSGATDGLNPKGKAIYSKLRARGFPHPRAMSFAKRAQNKVKGQGFGRSRGK